MIRINPITSSSCSLTRKSSLTGKLHTQEIPTSANSLINYYTQRHNGTAPLIQDAFPHLNNNHREFITNGITNTEWDTHLTE